MRSGLSMGIRRTVWKNAAILLILALFVFLGVHRAMNEDGDDLSTSFIGCRLIATGQAAHLYAHDPNSFAEIGPDTPWQQAADEGHYAAYLHPYVQTPLWAWSLQPLCTQDRRYFFAFHHFFAFLTLLSFAACIWLVARFWALTLYSPLGISLLCIALWFAEPFQYALALMQTHVLFFLLTILALILAERERPIAAGIFLALAAAVKITPGALLVYWLLTRRWKAAVSMAFTSVLLWGAAYLAVGTDVMHGYLATLNRVSQVLLLSQNNQSFAAWIMARSYPAEEVLAFQTFLLPGWVRLASSGFLVLCTLIGGLIDRKRNEGKVVTHARHTEASSAPFGAMIALVAATIFAPISWSHYSIILIAPLMILLNEQLMRVRQLRSTLPHRRLRPAQLWIALLIVVIAGLNYQPFAAAAVTTVIHPLTLVRSHFYAEVICLLTLAVVACASPSALSDPK